MSPKDLCTIDFLDQVLDTGVRVLKIEGRGRAPEYVATVIACYREAIDTWKAGTYSPEKVSGWMARLETVYNRGFWGGYYLGQELGEWTDGPGSKATQKKVYVGKGVHYFPKAGIAQFEMEAQNIKVGDKILVTGPSTGVLEGVVTEMMLDDAQVSEARKGDIITMPLSGRIRPSDKLYKLVEA